MLSPYVLQLLHHIYQWESANPVQWRENRPDHLELELLKSLNTKLRWSVHISWLLFCRVMYALFGSVFWFQAQARQFTLHLAQLYNSQFFDLFCLLSSLFFIISMNSFLNFPVPAWIPIVLLISFSKTAVRTNWECDLIKMHDLFTKNKTEVFRKRQLSWLPNTLMTL